MRIRKNTKLSSLLGLSSPPPAASQSHVCQLNQSPWDVIPFSPDSSPPTSSFHHHQLDGDATLIGNTSLRDALGPVDTGGSIEMVTDNNFDTRNWKQEESLDDNHYSGDNDNNNDNDSNYGGDNAGGRAPGVFSMMRGCCSRINGKGWQCPREAKEGQYLCEHHLKLHNTNNSITGGFTSDEPPALSAKKGRSGRRGRPPKRGPSSKSLSETNNSNQFYYYSKFGPSRGRRRAGRGSSGGGREKPRIEAGEESSGRSSETTMPPHPAGIGGEEEVDYAVTYNMDDEEEAGMNGESSGGGRKKTRKPVKARSLKSLM